MKRKYILGIKATLLLICSFLLASCFTSDREKISLYKAYINSKDYDSSNIEIPQIKVKMDLIDSSEFFSLIPIRYWKYGTVAEFKTMKVQSASKLKDRYEINLLSIFSEAYSREEYLASYYVTYIRRDTTWTLSKHRMFDLELLEEINAVVKKDSSIKIKRYIFQ